MRMFTGDLEPDLIVTLSGDTAVDATTGTIRIIGTTRSGALVFDRAPTAAVVDGDTTVVSMEWEEADTAAAGRIFIEVEVTWPGTRPETFRPAEAVDVVADYDLSATP